MQAPCQGVRGRVKWGGVRKSGLRKTLLGRVEQSIVRAPPGASQGLKSGNFPGVMEL